MNILIKLINDVKATLALIKAKTDTITADLFTSTHASRIDANISSRQASWGATTTHSSRLDASISSRALETTAQAIKAKTDLLSADALSGNVKSMDPRLGAEKSYPRNFVADCGDLLVYCSD